MVMSMASKITSKGQSTLPHPGRIVRQDFLEPLGLTVTEAARVLGVARQTINNLVNQKAGISAEMAVRLSKAFGPSPDMWVRLQANYDLSQVRQDEIAVAPYKRASSATTMPAISKSPNTTAKLPPVHPGSILKETHATMYPAACTAA